MPREDQEIFRMDIPEGEISKPAEAIDCLFYPLNTPAKDIPPGAYIVQIFMDDNLTDCCTISAHFFTGGNPHGAS
jgi:hypothetical protein